MDRLIPPLRVEVVASAGGFGGAERFALALLDRAGARIRTSFVALGASGLLTSARERRWPIEELRGGPRAFDVARDAVQLMSRWHRDPPEVVLANGVRAAAAAVPAGCLARTNVVWMKHDFSYDRGLAPLLGRLAARVIASSSEVAAAVAHAEPLVLPPPRPATPLPRADARAVLSAHGVPADAPLVAATIGRLVPYKGVDDVIVAMTEPATAGWGLAVIGADDPADPGERERLERLAADTGTSDRVWFVGEVPDAGRLLSAVDAVLVPTKINDRGHGREGHGMVADEAMAASVPVVATRGGPLIERIHDAGIAVDPGQPAQIAAALDRLRDTDVRRVLGEHGRRRATDLPDIDAVTDVFLAELTDVAARPGAGAPSGPPMSVVVPLYNEGDGVDALVRALVPQLRDGDELVLVDDGSTDDTGSRAGQVAASGRIVAIRQPHNRGAAAARNAGTQAAGHDVVACTDAGCEPGSRWLDALRAAFSGTRRPALVTGVYRVRARSLAERAAVVACYPDVSEARGAGLATRLYNRVLGRRFEAFVPNGRSLAFTRAAWETVGGFPEHLRAGEDVDFGRRVKEAGLTAALSVDAEVIWDQRPTLTKTARMYYRYGIGDALARNRRMIVRNLLRLVAIPIAIALVVWGGWPGLVVVGVGAALYLWLPLARIGRHRWSPLVALAVPVSLVVKDLSKALGCVRGLVGGRPR